MKRNDGASILKAVLAAVFVVAFLFLALITGFDKENITFAERIVNVVTIPFARGTDSLAVKTQDFFALFREIDELRAENTELKRTVGVLQHRLENLENLERENESLRELAGYREASREAFELETARVIVRYPENWHKTIIINKGSREGIREKMPVITPDGLVGKVTRVFPENSEVLLVTDSECAVGARINESRETYGVAEGSGLTDSYLKMIYLPHDADISVDDLIVTSGLGGEYPSGLSIGRVYEIVAEENGLMKHAFLEPSVSFRTLEDVLVVKNHVDAMENPLDGEGD